MSNIEIVNPDIEKYCEQCSDDEPEYLRIINRETHAKVLQPRMLSGHFQGRLLSLISNLIQPKYILEIGSYTGYSALCLAEGLKEGGKLITLEANEEFEPIIRNNIKLASFENKIDLLIGNAKDLLPDLNYKFDLVFIDADKLNYLDYYESIFEKVSIGGLILSDNILWSGKVINKSAKDKTTEYLRDFNNRLKNDTRTQKILLPIRDGIFVSRKIKENE
jgi:caffeoyl-CoA O-methyltransferase